MTEPTPNPTSPPPDLARGIARLERLALLAKLLLIVHRLAWIIAGAVAALSLLILIDLVLRSPGWLRGIILLVGGSTLLGALLVRVLPALRFKPSVGQIALRLERAEEGKKAGLTDLLTSAVEISKAPRAGLSGALATPLLTAAAERLRSVRAASVLRLGPAVTAFTVAAVALIAALSIAAVYPTMTFTGLRRTLTPWSDAAWPKRTQIADATGVNFHALNSALPIRAGVVRAPGGASSAAVTVKYRLITPQGTGETKSAELTSQNKPVQVAISTEQGERQTVPAILSERLLETSALTAGLTGLPPDSAELEYWLISGDDETAPARIALITPPAVEDAALKVTPPKYALSRGFKPLTSIDLGNGLDQRATYAGVLAGSAVELSVRFNKPVPKPTEATTAKLLGDDAIKLLQSPGGGATYLDNQWTIRGTAVDSARFAIMPRDERGVLSSEEAVFRIAVTPDKPAEVAVVSPARDDEVLINSTINAEIEARDDVALREARLLAQLARRPAGTNSGTPEPVGEHSALASQSEQADTVQTRMSAKAGVSLKDLGAVAGDEVWIWGVASDIYADAETGKPRQPTVSTIRKMRVISSEQLVERLYNQLEGVRRGAQRASTQQQRTSESTKAQGKNASEQQSQVGEQIAQLRQQLREVRERAAQNASKSGANASDNQNASQREREAEDAIKSLDNELARVLKEAEAAAKDASEASAEAQKQLAQAGQNQSQPGQQTGQQAFQQAAQQASQQAQQAQQRAKDRLDDLNAMLDRGQGAFAQRLRVQRLLEEQNAQREQAAQRARETAGKSLDQLSPQQRAAVEQAAQEQENLAARAEELLRTLREKGEQLKKDDPASSEALKQAAGEGERNGLSEQMRRASSSLRRNQQQSAQEQQQQAADTLKQMLQELNDAEKNRDAVLRRKLDSLVESIRTLIAGQTKQIDAVQRAGEKIDASTGETLAAAMITLHTSTLAAAQEAGAMGEEGSEIEQALQTAGARQVASITLLRTEIVDAAAALSAQRDALTNLQKALKLAEEQSKKAQSREQQRKAAELRKAYQETLEKQKAVTTRSEAAGASPADRRRRALTREIAQEQDRVRTALSDLLKANEGLGETSPFSLAHQVMDEASAGAAELLREDKLAGALPLRQATISDTLTALIEALDEASSPDEFRTPEEGDNQQNQGGGNQQGGQQPLIPPLAQLKGLRQMQQSALNLTRKAAAAAETPELAKLLTDQAAEIQKRLSQEAAKIIEQMNQQQGPGGGGGGGRGG
ncbi:MAG: hypothetical protein IBJ18_11760 [Phycisphaerales bacterium]|nr:hypothetical protein [Phycisphaerales bacterium]